MRVPNDEQLFDLVVDVACQRTFTSYEMVLGKRRYPELSSVRRIVTAVLKQQWKWSNARVAEQWDLDTSSVFAQCRSLTDRESKIADEIAHDFVEALNGKDGFIRDRLDEGRSV